MNEEEEGEWIRNDEGFPMTWVYIERGWSGDTLLSHFWIGT